MLALAAVLDLVLGLVNLGLVTDTIRTFDQLDTWMPVRSWQRRSRPSPVSDCSRRDFGADGTRTVAT
jgi:hypothetical protein